MLGWTTKALSTTSLCSRWLIFGVSFITVRSTIANYGFAGLELSGKQRKVRWPEAGEDTEPDVTIRLELRQVYINNIELPLLTTLVLCPL